MGTQEELQKSTDPSSSIWPQDNNKAFMEEGQEESSCLKRRSPVCSLMQQMWMKELCSDLTFWPKCNKNTAYHPEHIIPTETQRWQHHAGWMLFFSRGRKLEENSETSKTPETSIQRDSGMGQIEAHSCVRTVKVQN